MHPLMPSTCPPFLALTTPLWSATKAMVAAMETWGHQTAMTAMAM